jgi:putative ABC transport system ATP-binding protein
MSEIVGVDSVSRTYPLDQGRDHRSGRRFVSALDHTDLNIEAGEFLAIAGPSGSGKSTLLNLIGCIDKPTTGRILLEGVDTSRQKPGELTRLRREKIGFVFQTFNLIPVFTASENVEFPLLVQGVPAHQRREQVSAALESVGLAHRAHHRPDLLSGGERQRVAVARAIVHRPALVLADEPTANLDTRNATQLIDLMRELNRAIGLTFLFSTHDARLLEHADRIVELCDGRVASDRLATGGSHGKILATCV